MNMIKYIKNTFYETLKEYKYYIRNFGRQIMPVFP